MDNISNRDLMLRFCSMGNNCEFGYAQRAYDAEPPDLLRWSITEPGMLINMLTHRFEGIGDPDQIDVPPVVNGHFFPVHRRYNHGWHSWTRDLTLTPDDIRERECQRTPVRAQNLMNDLRAGQRIFVLRNRAFPEHVVAMLRRAFALYGKQMVLLVTEGDAVGLREIEGWLFGSIPRLADNADVPRTTDTESWLAICRLAASYKPVSG